jgi:hypothetical protein
MTERDPLAHLSLADRIAIRAGSVAELAEKVTGVCRCGTPTAQANQECAEHQARAEKRSATMDMPRYYSAALDEIYELRAALAYEAMQQRGSLELKTLPKSVREASRAAVSRMEATARYGTRGRAHSTDERFRRQGLLKDVGASGLLTRDMWEREVDRVSGGSGASGVTRNDA